MKWLEIIKVVLALVPVLIETIKAIEEAIPGRSQGEQKLAAIREMVTTVDEQANFIWPTLERAIGVLVNLFNTTGLFKK